MREITISAVRTDVLREMDLGTVETAMPQRAERARRFRFERDRLLCLGAGYLMMQALGIRSESEILLCGNGKPYAPGYPPFSISHSGVFCILAAGEEGTVGADIEEINEAHVDVAPVVYITKELAWMAGDPLDRFFRLWTWKESVMKATGLGMELEPRSCEVLPFTRNQPVRVRGREWHAFSGALSGYRYSVCADERIGGVRFVEYRQPL